MNTQIDTKTQQAANANAAAYDSKYDECERLRAHAQRLADALNRAVARLSYLHKRDGFNTKNYDAIQQGREALAQWERR